LVQSCLMNHPFSFVASSLERVNIYHIQAYLSSITLFKGITVLCGIDNILHNTFTLSECEEYSAEHYQSNKIFLTFRLNVRNIPHKIVSPAEHCYGSE
jgi:hypothetical protein